MDNNVIISYNVHGGITQFRVSNYETKTLKQQQYFSKTGPERITNLYLTIRVSMQAKRKSLTNSYASEVHWFKFNSKVTP